MRAFTWDGVRGDGGICVAEEIRAPADAKSVSREGNRFLRKADGAEFRLIR